MEDIGRRWRKSTHSGNGGECVEARAAGNGIAVRDTKDRTSPALRVTADAWRRFTASVRQAAL